MRVAVITGGMGGLGDSISAKMHAAGYRVVVTHSPRQYESQGMDLRTQGQRSRIQCLPSRRGGFRFLQGVRLHGLPKKSDPLIFWSTTRV